MPSPADTAVRLAETARAFHARGWAPATAGNYSAVLAAAPLRLLVSRSGMDKATCGPDDFLVVDERGAADGGRPSDETPLHVAIVRARGAGAVLHTHSVWNTAESLLATSGAVELRGLELLKALSGVRTHDHVERVPVVENAQDYARLSDAVADALRAYPGCHGLLLRGHGLYAWGADVDEARRHVEALEFLFEVVGRLRGWGR